MITLRTTLFMLICFTFLNCKNKTKTIEVAQNLELQLNNGKKWIANPETHEGIIAMDSIINAFNSKNDKDYNALGESLSKQTSYIIKSCSMKGEAHDQLHVVLVPMLDDISVLKDSKKITTSKNTLINLQMLIDTYHQYFKL